MAIDFPRRPRSVESPDYDRVARKLGYADMEDFHSGLHEQKVRDAQVWRDEVLGEHDRIARKCEL